MRGNCRFLSAVMKKTQGVTLSFFIDIFNFKRNAIMFIALSYITSDIIKLKILVGSGEGCELNPWRPGFKSG